MSAMWECSEIAAGQGHPKGRELVLHFSAPRRPAVIVSTTIARHGSLVRGAIRIEGCLRAAISTIVATAIAPVALLVAAL